MALFEGRGKSSGACGDQPVADLQHDETHDPPGEPAGRTPSRCRPGKIDLEAGGAYCAAGRGLLRCDPMPQARDLVLDQQQTEPGRCRHVDDQLRRLGRRFAAPPGCRRDLEMIKHLEPVTDAA